ncbi:YjjG family noncanonical pyrimidine nucleotidase [Chitinophaga sp. S165]|uniref:YjjG family noncanonical pyrimidine nucleotidase n=1 Tax=Chitinophaga sp. S165 TaxID=2135462 RepID=UPI000D71D1FE|nr:YjjG family noncanonical pyrimidine nucleotidase [Chitinophaga sp. S165]PWV53956.1 putative hydrolase of the HAD superfamily [Chitinophaga sp. S165]
MKYKHIFFDLDHTLWDFETNASLVLEQLYHAHNLESRGVPTFKEFHNTYMVYNEKLWDRFRKGFITRNDLRTKRFRLTLLDFKIGDEKLCEALGTQFLEELPTQTALFPHAKEVLEYLAAKNYPLHMITNGFEEVQLRKMRSSGIDHFFTHVITSESAGSLKPYKEIFDYAVLKANATADSSIMIGDALDIDILGAFNAGIDQVYFNPLVPANGDLKPTFVINSLHELKQIL